jgi:hypothetical protein
MSGYQVVCEEPIVLNYTHLPFWHGFYGICFQNQTGKVVCTGLGTNKKKEWEPQEKWWCLIGKVFYLPKKYHIWEDCFWYRIVERDGGTFLQGLE